MRFSRIHLMAALIVLMSGASAGAMAQGVPPPPAPAAPVLTPQQLDPLVAPVALYDHPLLADILTAATIRWKWSRPSAG